jgi:hypothetical protein
LPNYEILLTDDYERRRLFGPLPDDVIDIIEEGLRELEGDPWGLSRVPECPPFPPVGRLFSVMFRYGNTIYAAYFFFHIDDEAKKLIVRRAMTIPPFEPAKPAPSQPARRIKVQPPE